MTAPEKRRLGTTAGGSTYIVTLPKGWIGELGLKKGDELSLFRLESGIYIGTPSQDDAAPPRRTALTLSEDLGDEALARALISRYIAGFGVIELHGALAPARRRAVRATVQRLVGAEILQETGDFLLIHVLRDPQVLSAAQLLAYIRENVVGMLADAGPSLIQADRERARSVIQRDERVDRFFLLLSRRLYAALRDPLAEIHQQIVRTDLFNLHTVARQLERVADHAVKIAQAAEALIAEDLTVPPSLIPLLEAADVAAQEALQRAVAAFVTPDEAAAHRALEAVPELQRRVGALRGEAIDLEPHLAYHLGIVTDSIGRVGDYAANVAEVALNAGALRLA